MAQAPVTVRYEEVASRARNACLRAGRDPQTVEIMVVTKYAGINSVAELAQSGLIRHIAESRIADAAAKWADPLLFPFSDKVTKHFIGRLQTNKAGKAVAFADSIDSIDSSRLAETVSRKAQEAGKTLPVLIQIKLTDRDTQGGLGEKEARDLAATAGRLPNLKVNGYLAIAPIAGNPEDLRPLFRRVKQIFDADFPQKGGVLSLGMSGDFEIAVEEGSTLPRIGSAIFGGN
ncbi:MAG: YggS family pyridoxal phosphate-dependent enzyme [Elusimicrobiaceae bacterium]